jgi:hypothetical protein
LLVTQQWVSLPRLWEKLHIIRPHSELSGKMKFFSAAINVLSLLAVAVSSEREQEFATARIFLHKSTSSKFPLIVGSDFVVNYYVSNNGEASATSLVLTDRYDPSSFELIENVSVNGSVSFAVEELAPGALVR